MATEHSRRALLGGAGLALVAGTLPVVAASSADLTETATWDAAEANFRIVRARWFQEMATWDATQQRYFATPRMATEEEYERGEEEEQLHCGLDNEAMDRMMNTPAPHLRAVLLKLEQADEYALSLKPVLEDLRRLSGRARA